MIGPEEVAPMPTLLNDDKNPRISSNPESMRDAQTADHPFAPGDVVTVFGFDPMSGMPYAEGLGVISRFGQRAHHYSLKFLDDHTTRTRFVHPDWQADPQRSLALLVDQWQASMSPPDTSEFFPTIDPEMGA